MRICSYISAGINIIYVLVIHGTEVYMDSRCTRPEDTKRTRASVSGYGNMVPQRCGMNGDSVAKTGFRRWKGCSFDRFQFRFTVGCDRQ